MIPRYIVPAIEDIFSTKSKLELWTKIEIEALHSMQKHRVIPKFKIPRVIVNDDFITSCNKLEAETKHDVVAFTRVLESKIPKFGRFVHYGLTSSDIVDTALAIQLKLSTEYLRTTLCLLRRSFYEQAYRYKYTPIMGRTHGRRAEPTTFGLVLLLYVEEFNRHIERINQLLPRISVGKLSGSIGVYAHVPPCVEYDVMKSLNLGIEPVANQITQRDRHAELIGLLALISGTFEKFALQIRHYSRDEIDEVYEPFGDNQVGSSAMPHKKNPIGCENICGLARVVRGYAQSMLESMALLHERDISNSCVERIVIPDAFNLVCYMARRLNDIVMGLQVNKEQMLKHITETPWNAQAVKLTLLNNNKSSLTKSHENAKKLVEQQASNPIKLEDHLKHVDTIFDRIRVPTNWT